MHERVEGNKFHTAHKRKLSFKDGFNKNEQSQRYL